MDWLVHMDIDLRETLCLRNSGRNCHPVDHFKPRYRRAPYDHVFVQRLCGAHSSWTIWKSLPLFLCKRILLCVGISTPPPQLSPKRLWKDASPQDQGPCCYEKSKKVSNPKHIVIIIVQSLLQTNNFPSISGHPPSYYFSWSHYGPATVPVGPFAVLAVVFYMLRREIPVSSCKHSPHIPEYLMHFSRYYFNVKHCLCPFTGS